MARAKPTHFRRPRHWTLAQYLDRYSIPEPNTGCHLWFGAANRDGYGNASWQGKKVNAHRLSWIATNGPIPVGMEICHKCDVPACVNPDHLFLGTHQDNVIDANRKARWPSGANSVKAKLSVDQVALIRASNLSNKVLAKMFDVSRPHIWRIRAGHFWQASA